MITQITKRQFDQLSGHRKSDNPRNYWATLDRKRLGLIELEDLPRWRATVFNWDDGIKYYIPEHYADVWGTQADAVARLTQMLLAVPGPECG
jgi:hypothetical protein